MGRATNLFGKESGGYICQIRQSPLLEGCVNIIPTKANLYHRKVIEESLFEACGLEEETSGHAFRDCEHAREVWNLSGITFETQGVLYCEFVDLIWYLMFVQHVRDEVLEMVFMIVWCMWYSRNAVRHGSSHQSAQQIIQKARMLIVEF